MGDKNGIMTLQRRHEISSKCSWIYEDVPKSFRTDHLERELQMVKLSATRCSCIAILWVSPASFAVITLCVAFQRVFIVVYFVIDSVVKLLNMPSYMFPVSQEVLGLWASFPRGRADGLRNARRFSCPGRWWLGFHLLW